MLQMTELNGFLFKGFIETKINVPQSNSQKTNKGHWHLEKGETELWNTFMSCSWYGTFS